jgi:lysyl-tRNA synthetase class 2
VKFERDATARDLHDKYDDLDAGTETDVRVSIAGRVLLLRRQGKLIFATMRDASGTIQLFVSRGLVGDDAFDRFELLDLGDWVGATGTVMKTKKGELSVKVESFQLLSKALRPLPDKWHGLSDLDTRYRQRYADLISNESARRVFEIRFATLHAIRDFLKNRGFVEVETPVLHSIPGGAAARPFETHHNALDMELYLRIALELHLKRLVVGGIEKVFEIGRVFRNEGLSTRHNPEFTMLELYEAYADYYDMMTITEELVADAAMRAVGTTVVEWEGRRLEPAPPWERRTMIDLIKQYAGVEVHPSQPLDTLRVVCDEFEIPHEPAWGAGKLILEIYEKTTEPNIVGPLFVCDYPREVSPLARVHRDDPTLTERFEAVVCGRELGNAFSELNDPVDQMRRFEAQARLKQLGDVEAHGIDADYVRALEYGMPPTGGLGIGVDRLVMILAGVTSIREVILFPHLRPEAD